MAKYLDPKADLTFKKVFAEHKDLMISFLNAMLPLSEDGQVKSIEYLPAELVPENPLQKDTIVDVRCTDQIGRTFIVEMQMIWTPQFMQRVLLNSSKAYVRQIGKGGDYSDLHPVYSLNLVNDVFRTDTPDYYHDYGILDFKFPDHMIEGMHMIFFELPKFTPHSFSEKRMQVLWLRYLTEIDEKTKEAPKELLDNPETNKALGIVEESAYTEAQINGYDHFWDMVSVERTLMSSATKKGIEQGRQQGMQQGLKQGLQQGMQQGIKEGIQQGMKEGLKQGAEKEKAAIAHNLLSMKMPMDAIAKATGLTEEEIKALSPDS